jgi:hypothetical protein
MRQLQHSNGLNANVLSNHLTAGTGLAFFGHEQRPVASRKSFAAPAQVARFPQRPDASVVNESIPLFYIGQNRKGAWVVREAEGRSGGLFLFKQSAVRFARRQSEPAGCAIMFLAEPVELDIDSQGRCAGSFSTMENASHRTSLADCFADVTVAAWRKIVAIVSQNLAAHRHIPPAVGQELSERQYMLSSRNRSD